MYTEFFAFHHTFREIVCEILQNVKNDKCIAGYRKFHVEQLPSWHFLEKCFFNELFTKKENSGDETFNKKTWLSVSGHGRLTWIRFQL